MLRYYLPMNTQSIDWPRIGILGPKEPTEYEDDSPVCGDCYKSMDVVYELDDRSVCLNCRLEQEEL